MRRVLLIAYHFPPFFGSSGLQRTLRFAQYLPSYGWEPFVLTVSESALWPRDRSSMAEVPPGCTVIRVPTLDAQRHLSLFGYYPPRFLSPDRWATWSVLGPWIAAKACRANNINAIWSTYPIATAHRVGALTAQRTGLPWIADFRDPMIDDDFPSSPTQRRAFERVEAQVMANADRLVFVTPSAAAKYQRKYPQVPPSKFAVIENGYDESAFEGLPPSPSRSPRPLVFLHSGIVYPHERDPTALFNAVALLRDRGLAQPGDFVVRFRAAGHDDLLRSLADQFNVGAWIEIANPLGYKAALQEMTGVDALLLMQGRVCNEQIPAKLYEYLRAGRPIVGLADPSGDTGRKLRAVGVRHVAALEDKEAIAIVLNAALNDLRARTASVVAPEIVARYSRRELTRELAGVMDEIAGTAATFERRSGSPAVAR